GLALADTLVWATVAWCAVQTVYNFAQGPLSAILPDRVPRAVRGRFAALIGLGMMVGTVLGQGSATLFADSVGLGYVVLAALVAVVLVAFVVANPEPSTAAAPGAPFVVVDFLRTFWVNPR